ncbi:MAG: rhamnogalacturonan acetylesterase RhgT [Saprospiraceae bacterium]|nr:MAG: rhamnogalacturonan acetylesterase RhgT [Saprospiraceae bacterium]
MKNLFLQLKKLPKLILITSLAITLVSFVDNRNVEASINVFLIGDSTMANKPGSPDENPERGWGQLLSEFFKETATVQNHAVNGRSSKSFLGEGRWETILDDLESGDYVFIQFGHNDQKVADPKRYTNPWSGYRRNLEKFVSETRAKGAYPILLSSIVRRKFNEQGTLVDTHGPYPFVTRWVAEQMEVPFIDMQLLTEDYINEIGLEKSKEIYLWIEPGQYEKLPNGVQDNTHLTLKGATEYARLVAKELIRLDLPLAQYLK